MRELRKTRHEMLRKCEEYSSNWLWNKNEIPRWKRMENIEERDKTNNWKWGGEENTVGILKQKFWVRTRNMSKLTQTSKIEKMNYSQEHGKVLGARVKPIKWYANCSPQGEISLRLLSEAPLPLWALLAAEYELRCKKLLGKYSRT